MHYLNLSQVNKYLLTVNSEKWWNNVVKRSQVLVVESESLCAYGKACDCPLIATPHLLFSKYVLRFNIPLPSLQPGRPFD